jgi:hypothetical protein
MVQRNQQLGRREENLKNRQGMKSSDLSLCLETKNATGALRGSWLATEKSRATGVENLPSVYRVDHRGSMIRLHAINAATEEAGDHATVEDPVRLVSTEKQPAATESRMAY